MSDHTKEPWYLGDTDQSDMIFSEGYSVATVNKRGMFERDKQWQANARRIVAAVNFCGGVPTDTLVRLKDDDYDTDIYVVADKNTRLAAQVAQLRVLLGVVRDAMKGEPMSPICAVFDTRLNGQIDAVLAATAQEVGDE